MEAVASGRLRIAVFADSALQPRWMVESLSRAASSGHAEVSLVVVGEGAPRSAPLLWRAYSRVDARLFGSRERWSRPTDVRRIAPVATLAAAREAGIDVAFVLGDVDDASLEGIARYGTWRFCFGEAQGTREPLAAVREVLDAHPVVPSGIRIHPGGGRPARIACRSWARTFPFSMARSRDALFAKTADFTWRALRDLRLQGERWLAEGTEPAAPAAAESFPGSLRLTRDIATMGARVARRAAEKALTVDEWSIAFRFGAEEGWNGSLDGFFRLDPPRGGYWADPFPIQVNGRSYIFFEELPHGSDRGHISVVEVDREGRASAPVKALERPYHLSYPFLVEEGGQLYMIPETGENRTVEVYRCEEFPAKWKLERVLLSGLFCVDATLHREDSRWWMFANGAQPGMEVNDELFIFSSDALLGDWKPHARNPVKSDVRSSRPAGRLFRRGGQLYRPGQICTPLYGAGIALHRVERLTQDEYVEREESRIVPANEGVLGIHTINRAGDLAVADAFTRRARF